jgi:preprotein translocase subunit SecF
MEDVVLHPRHATDARVAFVGRTIVPHLAVVAFTVIAIILILIYVRFRFDKRFAKIVYLAVDALIFVFLIALIVICFLFSTR